MSAVKKMQIGRFAPQIEKVDGKAALELFESIRVCVDAIYAKNVSQYRYEVLHRSVYKLIINRHGDILYNGIAKSLTGHITESLHALLAVPTEQFLPRLTLLWTDHVMMSTRIREILLYSEKNYIPQSKKMPVYDLGLLIFRDTLVTHPVIQTRLSTELLRYVQQERGGLLIDRDSVRTALSMLLDLSVHGPNLYEEMFEKQFLEETRQFYRTEIQSFLAEHSCSSCLHKIEGRLQEEARHAQHYLPLSTGRKLDVVVEAELVANTAVILVSMERSGVVFMLTEDKTADLKLIFRVLCRVPATLEHLRACFGDYVVAVGGGIVADVTSTKDHVRFVREILQLKERMTGIVAACFANEAKFQNRLKSSFDTFLNKDSNVTALYLALYADELLKSGFRNLSDTDIESCVEGIVSLLQHVQDKDIFESYYKTYLTKRLMGGKSVSEEIEKQVVSKLKSEYGYQFTSKLERMFNDMNISRSTMEEFKQLVLDDPEYRESGGLDCEFTMLTAGFWPAQKHDDTELSLPPVLQQCKERFMSFYLNKHNARRISWQFSLGYVDIKMSLAQGRVRHDLNVSLYQAIVLYMFNERESVRYGDIAAALNIPEIELKRHLLSLCNPKFRILSKTSSGKLIQGAGDTFSLNTAFTSKFRRIKIPLMTLASVPGAPSGSRGEGAADGAVGMVPAQVVEDRKYAIDSALVRIMKARKTLSHNDLIAEVSHQLVGRFNANPQVLKTRIESLIEREYLARDRSTPHVYNYIA